MKIVSFNIRCPWIETQKSAENSFIHRAGMIYDKLRSERPEIIAFQEVTEKIFDFLKNSLSDIYDFYMFFRSENYDGEGLLLATLKGSVIVDGLERFWLSPTPSVPGSRFEEQSPCPRIAVIAECREISSGRVIRVCNLHLDHISDEARVLGMQVVLDKLGELNATKSLPAVILGDFNARPDSWPIALCHASSLGFAETTESIPVTFHDYGNIERKIDYIFATKDIADRVTETGAWQDEHAGIYLSDHYPIFVEV